MATVDLPDINVWLAMSAPDHVHRARAERYWREEASPHIAFTAITMLGFVRLASTAPIFNGLPLSAPEAWSVYLSWIKESVQVEEPRQCRKILHGWVGDGFVTSRTWTDAYLAAFALAGSLRLVSFDKDFGRFSELDFLHLS